MIFANRGDAGFRLVKKLQKYKEKNLVVLALPRGGVPVGFEVAKELRSPLKILVVRKIGAPFNPEFAIGAIAPEGIKVLDKDTIDYLGLSKKFIEKIETKERIELERKQKEYTGELGIPDVKNKTVILIDDGLATGMTALAAITAILNKNPKKLIAAFPVGAQESVEKLKTKLRTQDEVICLYIPEEFLAVGEWYSHFSQVSDKEVKEMLKENQEILAKKIPQDLQS
jgi:putative phosphoribosyl transferase